MHSSELDINLNKKSGIFNYEEISWVHSTYQSKMTSLYDRVMPQQDSTKIQRDVLMGEVENWSKDKGTLTVASPVPSPQSVDL